MTMAGLQKRPIDVNAIKRTLSTVRDTLVDHGPVVVFSGIGATAYCGWVVWLIVRNWV